MCVTSCRIPFQNKRSSNSFKYLLRCCRFRMYRRTILQMPGGVSLYSLSVAWVSLVELASKRGQSFATWLCSCLASFFCSWLLKDENYLTLPPLSLKGFNSIQSTCDLYLSEPIQIITNINVLSKKTNKRLMKLRQLTSRHLELLN